MIWLSVILVPILIAIGTAIFQWLWNITMPEVFGLKEVTFWQAFRILLLAGFLFGRNFNIGG